jgi:hypothetical protein
LPHDADLFQFRFQAKAERTFWAKLVEQFGGFLDGVRGNFFPAE